MWCIEIVTGVSQLMLLVSAGVSQQILLVSAGVSQPLVAVSAGVSQPMVELSAGVSQPLVALYAGVSQPLVAFSAGVSQPLVAVSAGVSQPILTYLLTPWCRVLLEKLTGLQLVKKFTTFHGTRRFITTLTSVRHLSLSWATPIQSIYHIPPPGDPS